MNTIKTNESGRSMIEMLGVLAIIGVLSVGGIAGYSKAMNKFKTNKVADNVSMIVANVKTLYAQQKTYDGLDNEAAVSMGIIPDELVVKTAAGTYSKLLNSFNGQVFISQSNSTNSTDGKAFILEFGSLSKEACITLATNDWGSGYSSGLIAMEVKNTSAENNATAGISTLGTVMIGENSKAKLSTGTAIAMPGATGTDTTGSGSSAVTTSQIPVPMPVVTAAQACACNAGNTCSISWKYY